MQFRVVWCYVLMPCHLSTSYFPGRVSIQVVHHCYPHTMRVQATTLVWFIVSMSDFQANLWTINQHTGWFMFSRLHGSIYKLLDHRSAPPRSRVPESFRLVPCGTDRENLGASIRNDNAVMFKTHASSPNLALELAPKYPHAPLRLPPIGPESPIRQGQVVIHSTALQLCHVQ
jgi:hypothetical protein